MWRAPIHRKGELPWKTNLKTSRRSSEAANADTDFPSETNVKRGFQGASKRQQRTAGKAWKK
jgi:hypothetical protein